MKRILDFSLVSCWCNCTSKNTENMPKCKKSKVLYIINLCRMNYEDVQNICLENYEQYFYDSEQFRSDFELISSKSYRKFLPHSEAYGILEALCQHM